MTLSKTGRITLLAGLLCLLLMGFSGAANAVIRWDVFASASEVAMSGRSEVLGSITLVVNANNQFPAITGNTGGGPSQIGFFFLNKMTIDNTQTSGIRVTSSNVALQATVCLGPQGSCAATQTWVSVENRVLGSVVYGYITMNIAPGVALIAGDQLRVDGVRGRIDLSDLGSNPPGDAYCEIQSIDAPASNQFIPDTFRVAKSFPDLTITAQANTAVMCLPKYGAPGGSKLIPQYVQVAETWAREFVAKDANDDGIVDGRDRTDGALPNPPGWQGKPTNGIQIKIFLNSIPASISSF